MIETNNTKEYVFGVSLEFVFRVYKFLEFLSTFGTFFYPRSKVKEIQRERETRKKKRKRKRKREIRETL